MHAISLECEVDRISDDVTVGLLSENQTHSARAILIAREAGIFAGDNVVSAFSNLFESQIKMTCELKNGNPLSKDQEILRMEGPAGSCLSLERTLINYLSFLSGIATLTQSFVEAVKPHPTLILATRKTLPGLRNLQLQAVVAGGGHIHRRNLSDGILIKENHQIFSDPLEMLKKAKWDRSPLHRVEIEVQELATLNSILKDPPDVIMLDNFSFTDTEIAIQKIRACAIANHCRIEVSGGMTIDKVARLAGLGVDYISVGQLTHSSPSLNMSVDFERL
ncbi:MAG: carboxylating nicotinate-nucleotide diphosphorylase [Bdellovibrionales bacterium]|nr:carboxylating nicotinate-nucleotide diphosphorylase [Bdellovibrionales bacterium]